MVAFVTAHIETKLCTEHSSAIHVNNINLRVAASKSWMLVWSPRTLSLDSNNCIIDLLGDPSIVAQLLLLSFVLMVSTVPEPAELLSSVQR